MTAILVALLLAASEPVPTAESVAALVSQLEAPRLADRQAAARMLEAIGPAALPLLPATSDLAPTAAEALAPIRWRLERALEMQATRASTMTLSGRFPAAEAISRLSQATGNRIDTGQEDESWPVIEVAWHEITFWAAIRDIEQKTRRTLDWNREHHRFLWSPVTDHPAVRVTSDSGPFRMLVRSLQLRQADEQELVRYECVLQVEPRLQPLIVQWPLRTWHRRLGQDHLAAWNPEAVFELPFPDNDREVTLAVDFPRGAAGSASVWTLSGECTVHLAAGREPLVFAGRELRRGAHLRRGSVSATLKLVRFDPAADDRVDGTVRIVVNYNRGGPLFESHRLGLFQRSAWLENAAGERVSFQRLEVVAEADGGLAVEYSFPALKPPATQYRFLYEAPTLLLEVPLQVRLSPP